MEVVIEECVSAFERGNKRDAERLLPQIRQPAKVRTTDDDTAASLLHLAARRGWVDVVVDLITKYKCNANCKDSVGCTPLHYTARKGAENRLEMIKFFINKQHCDPMTKDYKNWTVLHIACRNGHLDITHYLISEAHCGPCCKTHDGSTSLHISCLYGHAHIVQYLLSTGRVDPLAWNIFGYTPVDYASAHDNCYDLLKLFQSFPQCKNFNFPCTHTQNLS